uniref:Minichromosome loss protein Mcl1 middle region domain-containing protein n=1 Tax=Chaetoceros debilis TaxID=122233 RepID=A0A7S3QHM5_9STRA
MTNKHTKTIALNLEKSPTDTDRHLVLHDDHVYAYGGDMGIISAFPIDASSDAASSSASAKIIHQYDEAVRALAFSNDGQRVAVGYEDGHVDMYAFTAEQLQGEDSHPFLNTAKGKEQSASQSQSQDDGMDDLFTQGDDEDDDDLFSSRMEVLKPSFRLSHRFESSIRSLQFSPTCTSECYYLAIAADSKPGFLIANVTSSSSQAVYLEDEAEKAHEEEGIRSLSYSPDGNTLASLSHKGRLCLWNVPGGGGDSDPELEWEILHRDAHYAVQKPDMSAFMDYDAGDRSIMPVWGCTGTSTECVALPGEKDLHIRRSGALEKDCMILPSFGGESVTGELVGLAFDPSKKGYVVSSSRDGKISMWKVTDADDMDDDAPEGEFIANITSHDSLCTQIIWHKSKSKSKSKSGSDDQEMLFLAHENGSLTTIVGRDNIIPKPKKSTEAVVEEEMNTQEREAMALETQPTPPGQEKGKQKQNNKRLSKSNQDHDDFSDDDLFDSDDIGIDDAAAAAASAKEREARNQFIMDEAEDNDDDDDEATVAHDTVEKSQPQPQPQQSTNNNNNGRSADNNDDMEQQFDAGDDYGGDDYDMDQHQHAMSTSMGQGNVSLPEPQAPFAPSSTPISTSRRILCWNQYGVITSREREEVDGSLSRTIDISFVDSAARRPVSFRDPYTFIVGTIGEEGGLFVSDLVEDVEDDIDLDGLDGLNGMSEATKAVVRRSERRKKGMASERATGSCIYFHRFDTMGNMQDKDWTLSLPEGERAVGCASGEGWNAVVTSRRFLRLYSTSGMQGPIIWMKGDAVTVVGRGRFLAVIYHECNPLADGTQRLAYSLYDGMTGKKLASESVSAISKASSLTWAGFDENLSLFVMDEDGMLSMLVASKLDHSSSSAYSHSWVPTLDTMGLKKSREDSFWPICIQRGKLQCVPLKGIKHPDAVRRQLPTHLSLRMPLARGSGGKSIAMDEVSVRGNLALRNKQFVNDFIIETEGGLNAAADTCDHLENEYENMCMQVDKVTLKLIFTLLQEGQIERSFDLCQRLHLEASLNVAVKAAERCNQVKLSDEIHDLKMSRFPEDDVEEEDDHFDEDEQSIRSDDGGRTEESRMNMNARRVSPPSLGYKRKEREMGQEEEDDYSDEDESIIEEEQPQPTPKVRRKLNPFAKLRKESPDKAMDSPAVKAPKLSRMSTFSAQSRKKIKSSKTFL